MPTRNEISRQQRRAMLDAFNESVEVVRKDAVIKDISDALVNDDIERVLRLLNIGPGTFEPMAAVVREAFRQGGRNGAEQIGKIPTSQGEIAYRFDVRSPRAERIAEELSSGLVVQIVEDQRQQIRETMADAIEAGRNPRQSALDLVGRVDRFGKRKGGFIGMTRQQAGWSKTMRKALEPEDGIGVFVKDNGERVPKFWVTENGKLGSAYELRDKRFDGQILKAIKEDKPIPQKSIDSAVTQMQSNTLRYRGETIARTESINALRAGQHESVQQAIEEGDITEQDATKVWDASGDSRVRSDHNAMDGQRRQMGVPFDAPDGSQLMFPGDTSLEADPSQTVNCRCRERVEVDFAGEVRRIEGFD